MTNPLPADVLEERAAEDRRRLIESVSGLRSSVRERLDVRRNVRQNFSQAAAILAAVALVLGYTAAGPFAGD